MIQSYINKANEIEKQASDLVSLSTVSYEEMEITSDNILNFVVEIEEIIEETRELIKVQEMQTLQEMES